MQLCSSAVLFSYYLLLFDNNIMLLFLLVVFFSFFGRIVSACFTWFPLLFVQLLLSFEILGVMAWLCTGWLQVFPLLLYFSHWFVAIHFAYIFCHHNHATNMHCMINYVPFCISFRLPLVKTYPCTHPNPSSPSWFPHCPFMSVHTHNHQHREIPDHAYMILAFTCTYITLSDPVACPSWPMHSTAPISAHTCPFARIRADPYPLKQSLSCFGAFCTMLLGDV